MRPASQRTSYRFQSPGRSNRLICSNPKSVRQFSRLDSEFPGFRGPSPMPPKTIRSLGEVAPVRPSLHRAFRLKWQARTPIVGLMKRVAVLVLGFTLFAPRALLAQDAATEERFNKLAGQVEDLRAGQESLGKRIDALAKEFE